MLATYPDVFSGGAIIAGLPYRCATDIPEAFQSMSQGRTHSAREWGDLVRSASHHKGPWPKVSVWHGSADTTVTPMNAGEIIKQWLNVHEVLPKSFSTDEIDGYPHRIWHDASGEAVLEEYIITGMAHGTPLATADNENNYGATGPYLLEAGISSSYHIATFWGLTDSRLTDEQLSAEDQLSGEDSEDVVFTPQASPSGPSSMEDNLLTFGKPESASRPGSKSFDVQGVIEKALKTAGLMK
jgi:feruloyl esterase